MHVPKALVESKKLSCSPVYGLGQPTEHPGGLWGGQDLALRPAPLPPALLTRLPDQLGHVNRGRHGLGWYHHGGVQLVTVTAKEKIFLFRKIYFICRKTGKKPEKKNDRNKK